MQAKQLELWPGATPAETAAASQLDSCPTTRTDQPDVITCPYCSGPASLLAVFGQGVYAIGHYCCRSCGEWSETASEGGSR